MTVWSQKDIDRGAEALRQHEQGGRLLRGWSDLPNNDRKKWREKSELVLRAISKGATADYAEAAKENADKRRAARAEAERQAAEEADAQNESE